MKPIEDQTTTKDPTAWTRWSERFATWLAGTWTGRTWAGHKIINGWRRSAHRNEFSYRQVFIAGLVVAGLIGSTWNAITIVDQRQRASDRHTALAAAYDVAKVLYDRQVDTYQNCLDAAVNQVKARDALRHQFIQEAVDLRASVLAIFPDSTEARTTMDGYVMARQISIDAGYKPYVLADLQGLCQLPGPRPVDPSPS